jgi:hypothetical protein
MLRELYPSYGGGRRHSCRRNYIKQGFHVAETCFHCGGHETPEVPFEASHRIPRKRGYRAGFSIEWLDDWRGIEANVVWAHKGKCNKACELPVPTVLYDGDGEGYLVEEQNR